MKKRFTEAQIIGFLRDIEAGVAVKDLCRQYGFSEASYYVWRTRHYFESCVRLVKLIL